MGLLNLGISDRQNPIFSVGVGWKTKQIRINEGMKRSWFFVCMWTNGGRGRRFCRPLWLWDLEEMILGLTWIFDNHKSLCLKISLIITWDHLNKNSLVLPTFGSWIKPIIWTIWSPLLLCFSKKTQNLSCLFEDGNWWKGGEINLNQPKFFFFT